MTKRKKSSDKHFFQVGSETFPSPWRLRILAGVMLIAMAAFLAYLPSINGGFILDDDILITDNPLIKASDGLYRFWCTTETPDYWPVTNTTLWIEWRLWGMNSTGYHVTNLILHVAESLLIWIILRKLSIPGAFLAAVIFTIHPINVESVAWIAQRKDMLAMLFFLLSILWYLKHFLHPSHPSWYWLSLAAFMLALLSKGSVAVLPILLLGIVWWLRPLTKWDLVRIGPFFVVAAALTGVNIWFQTHGTEIVIRNAGILERLLGAGGVIWFYLYKALLPVNLAFVYPQWHIQVGNLLWWLPISAALLVTAVLWWYRTSWSRPFLFAWGFFCVALAPVMGFTDVGFMKYSLVADHYQHIAIIGIIALMSALWSVWHERAQGPDRSLANTVAVFVLGTLVLLTWQQSAYYRNAISLYTAALQKNPDFWLGQNNLGNALLQAGRPHEAIEHYQKALQLKPDFAETRDNLLNALVITGRPQEAIEHCLKTLKIDPNNINAHYNLGNALVKAGRPQEAIEHYQKALQLKPDFIEAHNSLSVALVKAGRFQEAIEHYRQALQLKPDFPEALNNLGNAFKAAGQYQQAIEHYQKALQLKPDYIETYYNLALVYALTKQPAEAVASAQKALDLAQSKGQAALAKKIENWLNYYRAGLSRLPNMPPPSKSSAPPP